MRALAQWVIVQWGWRRALSAFAAGAASVLALSPFHVFAVLWLTLPVLVWLIDGIGSGGNGGGARPSLKGFLGSLLRAGLIGWCFGFGYFLAGLYWVGFAFMVEADMFGWMAPFAVAGLPAGLAIFTALGTMAARLVWSSGLGRIAALAVGLAGADWLRGHVLTGFPWNGFGQSLTAIEPMMQLASIVGLYGLGFLAVLIFAAPAAAATIERERPLAGWTAVLGSLALLAGLVGYGMWRLPATPVPDVAGVQLRLVQPAIPQKQKWLFDNRSKIFADYLSLSDKPTSPTTSGIGDVTHVIWPESALPFVLSEQADALSAIAALLPPGRVLITGAVRRANPPVDARGLPRAYNSIHAIDDTGRIFATYDKVHLVPFGEYLPFQDFLERQGLQQLTRMKGGFESGANRATLRLPGLPPVSPLICYEIIFPDAAAERTDRPGWLLNLTNDAWFGDTSGPRQHLQQARLRAVEEGLPVVRVANTGISAVIDPYGRILSQLALNERGVIDSGLPQALPATIYVRQGPRIVAGLFGAGGLLAVFAMALDRRVVRRARRRKPA